MIFAVWLLLFFFILAAFIFHRCTRKYLNPYKLIMVFGKKGAGKTTLLTKLAVSHHRKGWKVYSTEPVPFAYLIAPEQIGFIQLDPDSVLLIDEVGMIYDNRNFKNFKPEVRDFFKLQRHYRIKCYMFSQTFDIDIKLRNLCDSMYLVTNRLRVFSWAKRIRRTTVLVEASGDAPSRIDENLEFEPFLLWPFGTRFLTFIPAWAKYFDSHGVPLLASASLRSCAGIPDPPTLRERIRSLPSCSADLVRRIKSINPPQWLRHR